MVNIHITGLVQGVGFRPFVYRLAKQYKIEGSVDNRNDGVHIQMNDSIRLDEFLLAVRQQAPPASRIEEVRINRIRGNNSFTGFSIVSSISVSSEITAISPDIAVCSDCLQDMKHQPHRTGYPFINCTNCGPRFTIIKALPYDREKTTMDVFPMCELCCSEYADVADRRFHAQPVACNHCGPEYSMHIRDEVVSGHNRIIGRASALLQGGGIIAIKGLGGFFIACDAGSQQAVQRLRSSKKRDAKPFAVMFRDTEVLQKYVHASAAELAILTSWRRPVVLLRQHSPLASSVNDGLKRIGAMLPYMPLHYLLFEAGCPEALVMTSGNLSEEPIIIDNTDALNCLGEIADAVITYNRDIYNRCDDSVTFYAAGTGRIIRRSRAYVPETIKLAKSAEGIFATGAELKNTFCLGKADTAIMSQHIGDLKNAATFDFYRESAARFMDMFRCKPHLMATDLHPDYYSSRYASESGLKVLKVQHHHAHIAACMAEYRLNGPVLGVCFDGLGLGTDQAAWGGEFLLCRPGSFERYSHFEYVPLPGGDKASTEPWRMALSYLYAFYGAGWSRLDFPFTDQLNHQKADLLVQAMKQKLNSPPTSACGRLFDAVAALCGLCSVQAYEAQAPMMLESLADGSCNSVYPFLITDHLSFSPAVEGIVNDLRNKKALSYISASFHNTVSAAVLAMLLKMRNDCACNVVVLSGGSFQNIILLENCLRLLTENNFRVYIPSLLPMNDGGISLGQLFVASSSV